MRLVPVKSVDNQAEGMVLRVREPLVRAADTADQHCAWARRGVRRDRGQGRGELEPLLTGEDRLPSRSRPRKWSPTWATGGGSRRAGARIDRRLAAAYKANPLSQRLAAVPGVGPVTALTMAMRSMRAFESGRHFAAWPGLTPRERSTAATSDWAGSAGRAMNGSVTCWCGRHLGDPPAKRTARRQMTPGCGHCCSVGRASSPRWHSPTRWPASPGR